MVSAISVILMSVVMLNVISSITLILCQHENIFKQYFPGSGVMIIPIVISVIVMSVIIPSVIIPSVICAIMMCVIMPSLVSNC